MINALSEIPVSAPIICQKKCIYLLPILLLLSIVMEMIFYIYHIRMDSNSNVRPFQVICTLIALFCTCAWIYIKEGRDSPMMLYCSYPVVFIFGVALPTELSIAVQQSGLLVTLQAVMYGSVCWEIFINMQESGMWGSYTISIISGVYYIMRIALYSYQNPDNGTAYIAIMCCAVIVFMINMTFRHVFRRFLKSCTANAVSQIFLLRKIIDSLSTSVLLVKDKTTFYYNRELKTVFCPFDNTHQFSLNLLNIINSDDIKNKSISYNQKEFIPYCMPITEDLVLYTFTNVTGYKQLDYSDVLKKQWRKLMLCFSHEFRTPLNWLAGALSLIPSRNDYEESLNLAKSANKHLLFYINNLISYNSMQKDEYTPLIEQVYIESKVLESVNFNLHGNRLSKNKIVYTIDSSAKNEIGIEPEIYVQVLSNILINSSNSSKTGASSILVEMIDGNLYTYVKDNGECLSQYELSDILGIPEEHEPSDKQFRYGFAMKFCKQFCEKLDGGMKIYSNEIIGNLYVFWMKAQIKIAEPPNISIDQSIEEHNSNLMPPKIIRTKSKFCASTGKCKKKQILIVDDNKMNNLVVKKMLLRLDIESTECYNGREALNEVKNHATEYNLILMDINMPVMDGIEATSSILKFFKECKIDEVPIIGLSAQSDKKIMQDALASGMKEYITKPISQSKLQGILTKYNC